MALPLSVCLYYQEKDSVVFLVVLLLTVSYGIGLNMYNRPQQRVLRRRDGLLLASVAWVVFSLFGMLPYLFCATPLNVSEGFFEAMSGFTTTGATVIREVERCGRGILLWRAVTQWQPDAVSCRGDRHHTRQTWRTHFAYGKEIMDIIYIVVICLDIDAVVGAHGTLRQYMPWLDRHFHWWFLNEE